LGDISKQEPQNKKHDKQINALVYCASADLMERNLLRRVEVCFPVDQVALTQRILNELELYLTNEHQRWTLDRDGEYRRVLPKKLTKENVQEQGEAGTLYSAQQSLLNQFC